MKKILVIDDSNTNTVLLEAILDSRGFKTITALSVKEAYSLLEKEKPELILLDLLMPKVSGYEFLNDIKKKKETKDIPVIIVSAVVGNQERQKTMELGAIDYIEKPVDIKTLVSRVEETLSKV